MQVTVRVQHKYWRIYVNLRPCETTVMAVSPEATIKLSKKAQFPERGWFVADDNTDLKRDLIRALVEDNIIYRDNDLGFYRVTEKHRSRQWWKNTHTFTGVQDWNKS